MLLLNTGGKSGSLRTTTCTEAQFSETTEGLLCKAFPEAAQRFTLFVSYTTIQIISRQHNYYSQIVLMEKRKNNYNLTPQIRD